MLVGGRGWQQCVRAKNTLHTALILHQPSPWAPSFWLVSRGTGVPGFAAYRRLPLCITSSIHHASVVVVHAPLWTLASPEWCLVVVCCDGMRSTLDAQGRRHDADQRPELSCGTVEWVAPTEYMVSNG